MERFHCVGSQQTVCSAAGQEMAIHWLICPSGSAEMSSSMPPGDFRSWESPQTLPALFIGPFEHVERFRNLKFAVIRITDIQSTVLSSSEGTAAIHLAFK